DPVALNLLIENWCDFLTKNKSLDLAQICYNVHTRRSHYYYRLAIIANTTIELYNTLLDAKNNLVNSPNIFFSGTKKQPGPAVDVSLSELKKIDLNTLANLYVNHYNIDWMKYEGLRSYPHIEMPLYPWQHKICWPVFK